MRTKTITIADEEYVVGKLSVLQTEMLEESVKAQQGQPSYSSTFGIIATRIASALQMGLPKAQRKKFDVQEIVNELKANLSSDEMVELHNAVLEFNGMKVAGSGETQGAE